VCRSYYITSSRILQHHHRCIFCCASKSHSFAGEATTIPEKQLKRAECSWLLLWRSSPFQLGCTPPPWRTSPPPPLEWSPGQGKSAGQFFLWRCVLWIYCHSRRQYNRGVLLGFARNLWKEAHLVWFSSNSRVNKLTKGWQ